MTMRMSSLICVRNGALLLSKVWPCSYKLVQASGWSDVVVWFRHLPSASLPNSSDPEQRCHSLPIPVPDSPLCVATQGWTHAMRLGWKGERKLRGVCSFSVHTQEWIADVKLHHHTEACEVAASQTRNFGVEQGWMSSGRKAGKKMQRERVQGYKQRHLHKVPEENWDESRWNRLCNCHNIKNRLCCILRFHL